MDKGTLNKIMRDWLKDANLWGKDKYFVAFEINERDKFEELDIRTTVPGTIIGTKGKYIDKYSYIFRLMGIKKINVIPIKCYFSGKTGA